MCAYI